MDHHLDLLGKLPDTLSTILLMHVKFWTISRVRIFTCIFL